MIPRNSSRKSLTAQSFDNVLSPKSNQSNEKGALLKSEDLAENLEQEMDDQDDVMSIQSLELGIDT